MKKATCPNCEKTFNCAGTDDCWCLKVDTDFDYEEMIMRTGMVACVCPVCLTRKAGADAGDATGEAGGAT